MSGCWPPLATWPEAVSGGGGHSGGLRSPQVWGGFGRGKGTPTLAPLAGLQGGRPHRQGGIVLALLQC